MLNLNGEEYLTAAEACALMGVKPATLYAYVSRGLLASYRQGIRRRRLYKRQDVDRLLQIQPGPLPLTEGHEVPRAEDWIPFVN